MLDAQGLAMGSELRSTVLMYKVNQGFAYQKYHLWQVVVAGDSGGTAHHVHDAFHLHGHLELHAASSHRRIGRSCFRQQQTHGSTRESIHLVQDVIISRSLTELSDRIGRHCIVFTI